MRSSVLLALLALLALVMLCAVPTLAQDETALAEVDAALEAEVDTELEAFTELEAEAETESEASTELTVYANRRPFLRDAAKVKQGKQSKKSSAKKATKRWVMYKQCSKPWGPQEIGTGGQTICKVGCAMSSVAMALSSKGRHMTPGTLNTWLKGHGGYVDGDLLNWAAVSALGTLRYHTRHSGTGSLSAKGLAGYIKRGWAVVVNVRGGGHWVLVTGPAGPSSFHVNDPYFKVNEYPLRDMSNFVVYSA